MDEETTSATLLASIVDSADDAIYSTDLGGKVTSWNRAAERLFGYSAAEMIGRPVTLLGEDGQQGQRREVMRVGKGGAPVRVSVAQAALRDREGRAVGVGFIAHRTSRAESELIASLSHDLRTPLNAIIGFARLMAHGKVGPISPTHQEFLGDILKSAGDLLRLINDVVDLAKIDAGKLSLEPGPIELPRLAGEVRDGLRELAAEKQVRIEIDIDPACAELELELDAERLKQVLHTYLSSALELTGRAGRLVLRARPHEPAAVRLDIEVSVLGSGHAKKHPGLDLSRRLVEMMGGTTAQAVGARSVFSAVLPGVARRTPGG